MIIKLLADLVYNLLNLLLSGISFPQVPEEISLVVDQFLEIVQSSMGFVWLIFPRDLCLVLIPVLVAMHMAHYVVKLIMWILRKIPFLGFK